MIINNELYFNMTIGDYTDFLKYEDLLLFSLTENSGAMGVIANISFRTQNLDIKNSVISNNQVKIEVGPDKAHCETYTLYPYEIEPNNAPHEGLYIVTFTAVSCLNFLIDMSTNSYTGTSIEVINQISQRYFYKDIHNEVLVNETKHPWIRGTQTGSQYMCDVWLHAYAGMDDCPLMYINKDNEVFIKSLKAIKDKGPTRKFIQQVPPQQASIPTYQYFNNFTVNSYKYAINEITGYGDVCTIRDTRTGKESIFIPENKPDLASTSEVEKAIIQNTKITENLYQSDNMHENYQKAYRNNIARLIRLASIEGELQIAGFYPEINVLELVDVVADNNMDSGQYIIDTKIFALGYNQPIVTYLGVTRDNRNMIENFDIIKKQHKKLFTILNQQLTNALQAIRNLRRVVVMCRQVLNGHFLKKAIAFLNNFKYNLLTSFSLFGVTLNFNNALALVESLKAAGNAFCNQLIDAYIPYPYNYVFRNFAVERPSLKTILSKLLYQFSPSGEFRALIIEMMGLFSDLTGHASDIYNSNYKTYASDNYANGGYGTGTLTTLDGKEYPGENMNLIEEQNKIQDITTEFINNTSGADIPIPQISLTESESLLPYDDLKDLLADKTVDSLTQQGYLYDIDDFKSILLGYQPMDFNTINKINQNIGNMLYARFWGTFNTPDELTDFYINSAYKDIYVTVPTTKIINALRGAKIFMALPSTQKDLIFYINNKEVEMDVMENIDLGLYTISGYPLLYNIYMSKEQFNSNSVILEVRKTRS